MSKDKKKGISAYDRGVTKGHTQGYEYLMNIILYVMQDKYCWETDELVELYTRLEGINTAIERRNISMRDIQKVLRDEYDIEFAYADISPRKKAEPLAPEQYKELMLEELRRKYNGKI